MLPFRNPVGGTSSTIGSFWAYGTGLSGPHGARQGLLGVGFTVGGPSAGNLGPPPPEKVDGLAGAILGWNNTAGANASVTGYEPLVYNSIVFVLAGSGLPSALRASDFSDLSFQFGTELSDPNLTAIPEPTALLAGALLLLPFGASTLRFLRRNRTA